MRSSLTALPVDGFVPSTGGKPRGGFASEIAAAVAAQVFADGLADMWAARRDAKAARPAGAVLDRRALIASLTSRADTLAVRAAVAGAPGDFAQAAASIRDLAARGLQATDARAPHLAGRHTSRVEASGSAS